MKTYLKARLLIDGTGADPIENPVLVMEGDRITEVGPSSRIEIPSGAAVIDRGDEVLIPGLIDSHCHAGEDSKRGESVREQHTKPDAHRALRGYVSLHSDLMCGVTTMRLLGDGGGFIDKILRDSINCGELVGPRLLVCCLPIRPSHGTAPEIAEFVGADGVDEVRKRVRQAIFHGADVIKLFTSNISNGDTFLDYLKGDLTGVAAYTKEEMAVAVEEAHRCGKKVAAHCIGGPAIRWGLEAGIDSLEHVNLMEESDIPYFLQYGGYISDPNLHLFFDPVKGFESPLNKSWVWDDLPDWWHQKVWKSRENTRRVMGKALKEGVKFALATDLNHGGLWLEAKYFVQEIGATPMQALQACTRNGADCCGILEETGTLEAGKYADVVSLAGNPLENIEHLKDVRMVVKQGTLIRQ
ncbi:amidohydrolase family protein [Oscillibacter hominis]|uniref:Amidohydrolase family protein n=1 Tax=Oscillibacter hominis TaxID=2763056 RepID=A0A7G9B852_9FIRM|nr:amidohydrolase family protein [Oscillibacter hominis]QNL45733.1 amidohydrolase family protein [Oscillibacter hominis]